MINMVQVFIKMVDTSSGNEYPWTMNKFIVRYGHMQEMYDTFESTGHIPPLSEGMLRGPGSNDWLKSLNNFWQKNTVKHVY